MEMECKKAASAVAEDNGEIGPMSVVLVGVTGDGKSSTVCLFCRCLAAFILVLVLALSSLVPFSPPR
jgi:hypothetical protein